MDINKKPLVSVIIPFMNEERFLEETISSVIGQSYHNWELLLIDDGSTNSSTDIALKYAQLYPDKIFYHEHENHQNKGVCVSRNLGVEKAKGTLIALLDADDFFLPGKLEHQVQCFEDNPEIGMVAGASYYWFKWSDNNLEDKVVLVGEENDKVIDSPQLMFNLYPLGTGNAPCPCSLMIKKEVIEKVNGFEPVFKKEYQLYEDQAFLVKIYLTEKVYISSVPDNLYRQRQDSVVYSTHGSGEYQKVRLFFLKWLKNYLLTNKPPKAHNRIIKLVDKTLYRYNRPFYHRYLVKVKSLVSHYLVKGLSKFLKLSFL